MKSKHFKFFFSFILAVILTLGLSISFQSLLADWTSPVANPPNSNTDAPLNVGSSAQIKQGSLWVVNTGGISPWGLLVEKGNVGIGTITPLYNLDVYPATGYTGDLFRVASSTGIAGNGLIVKNNGNVGIGTTAPGASLDVASGQLRGPNGSVIAGNGPGIAFTSYADTGLGANSDNLAFWESGVIAFNLTTQIKEFRIPSDFYYSWSSATNNNMGQDTKLYRNSANVMRTPGSFIIDGSVGIGTTNPGYKLDVSGDLRISGGGAFGGYNPSATHKLTTPTLYAREAQIGDPAGGLKGPGSLNASNVCIEGVCQNSWSGIGGTSGWTDDGTVVRLTTVADNVGIGTVNPLAKLQVQDGAVLFNGMLGNTPTSGAGRRLMWIPIKTAFRAGEVDGNQWDDANIGDSSIGLGYDTIASGGFSVSLGSRNTASGIYSAALGGGDTMASGDWSAALGRATTASGDSATALGYYTKAESYGSLALGRFNVGGGTADSWVATDPLFEIGVGTSGVAKANALTVLKNGNIGIGTSDPESYRLKVQGDAKITGALTIGALNTSGASYLNLATNVIKAQGTASEIAINYAGTAKGFTVYNNTTSLFRVDSAGDVSVAQALTVIGNITAAGQNVCRQNGVNCPAAAAEIDPVWTAASANYYTKVNLQTSGQAQVNWGNLSGIPGYVLKAGDTMTGDLIVNKATPLVNLKRTSGNPEIDFGDATNHWGIYNAYDDSNKLKFWYGSNLLSIDTAGNLTIAGTVDGIDISAKAPVWDAKEPAITPGTTAQYWRGDKTWQILPSGTVTSITAGAGLSGGTITTTGTISLNLANPNTWTVLQTYNAGIAISGGNLTFSQTSNPYFYIDSNRGVQIRLDADNNTADEFAINNGANAKVFSVDESGTATTSGNLIVGGKLNVSGADVAEEFATNEELDFGTVVVMGDEGIKTAKPCEKKYDKKVIGVVSDNPSVIMGKIPDKIKAAVALIGVVKVKVTAQNGKIEKGDLLVTSDLKGYAMKATEEKVGTIIGKALENFSGQTGQITALVNLQ